MKVFIDKGLKIIDEQGRKKESRQLDLSLKTIDLIIVCCNVKMNKFYIPGETNISERLRKRALETGAFTLLTYLYDKISSTSQQFTDVRNNIRNKMLNWAELKDLAYHAKVLDLLSKQKREVIHTVGEEI